MSSWGSPHRGVTLVEYGLLIILIGGLVFGALSALGGTVASPFGEANSALNNGGAAGGSAPTAAPAPEPEPMAGQPELVCATGFAPGSSVTVNFNPVGPSQVSGGQLGTLVADSSGEVCEEITLPVDAPSGDYSFELIGSAPGGAPHNVIKPPITVVGQPVDTTPITPPDVATDGPGTMTVQVRSCSAVYHRANATMNSTGTLYPPGHQWEVYATQGWWTATANADIHDSLAPAITGGTWPVYSCDGGSSNTWFQLTDGSGYVFTGGVDIISGSFVPSDLPFSENFNASSMPTGWSGLTTSSEAGAARTADNALGLGPELRVSPAQLLALRVDTKDNSGSAVDYIGVCFRASSGAVVNVATDCQRVVVTDSSTYIESLAGTVVPSGKTLAMVYLSGNQYYNNVVLTLGVPPSPTVIASTNFETSYLTDQGDAWPGCCNEATSGTGGSRAKAGSGYSRWWAVGPNTTVRLTIDTRTSGGSGPYYTGLQIGMPGDAACASPTTGNCAAATMTSTYSTKVVTITTAGTNQWIRYFSIGSQKNDNVTIEIIN